MFKKVISLTIVLAMVSTLMIGCGNKSTAEETKTAETTVATSTQAAVDTQAEKNNEEFKINISGWFLDETVNTWSSYKDLLNKKYKEKYPNATVVLDNLPGEKYMEVIKAKLASNSADELIFHQYNTLFSKAGYLMDVSDQPFVSNLLDGTKSLVSYQGKVYGAPQAMQTFGAFYNKKIFADNQIEIPKNWSEFLAVCEKLKAKGITPLGAGFKDSWVAMHTFQNIFMPNFILDKNPNFLADLYNGKVKINSPEMKGAITKFADLATNGYFQKSMFSTDWMTSGTEFANGKYAMLIQGQWLPGMLDSSFKGTVTSKDCGYFPIAGESGKPIIALGIDHILSVNANVQDKQRALDLFNIMISEEGLSTSTIDTSFPGIKSNVKHTIAALSDVQNALATNATCVPGYSFMPPSVYETEMTQILQKALAGKGISDADLDKADKTYETDKALAAQP
ncbi:MAG TPA: extracellular solute-binding protein [Ruminiclostridium sp.]